MQSISKERTLQAFVLNATTVSNAFALIFFAFMTLLGFKFPGGVWLIFIITPLAVLGLVYNFFIFDRVSGRHPYTSSYFSISFVMAQFFTVIVLTGGFASPYYGAWLLLISISCALGMRVFYTNVVLAVVSYLVLLALGRFQAQATDLIVIALGLNGLSLLFGAFVALAFEQFKSAASLADRITNQMDSTRFSEKLMLSSIADAVIGVNDKREIILFNSAAEDITGWDAGSANGVFYTNAIKLKDSSGADLTNASDPFLEVFETKSPLNTDEFYLLDKDNNKVSLSISIAPTVDVNNEISGAIAVLHDISQQKAVQRERNEFVSTASHEMRTPVASIEGYLSMAINPNLATIDNRARNFLEKAHDSALHLGKLFQDLLSVTKIEDQRLKESRQIFNISDLITQITNEMEIVASKKGLKLFTQIGGSTQKGETVIAPVYNVKADPERVREVITNLVDNAIKYTPKGSIEISLKADRNFVTVGVRDSGIGIPPDEQKHMFEKFYRVSNKLTRETGGTGLGLYIARSLIEMYGGKIWVESKEGEGSTFSFTLPLVKNK